MGTLDDQNTVQSVGMFFWFVMEGGHIAVKSTDFVRELSKA